MEFIDLFDKDDRPLGRTVDRHHPRTKDEYRRITELWIRRPDGRYLIQQRSKNKKLYALKWSCSVSGAQSAGESPMDTALRETKEELGLVLRQDRARFFGRVTDENVHFHIYLFTQDVREDELTPEPMEVEAVRFVTKEEMDRMIDAGDMLAWDYYPAFFLWAEEIK